METPSDNLRTGANEATSHMMSAPSFPPDHIRLSISAREVTGARCPSMVDRDWNVSVSHTRIVQSSDPDHSWLLRGTVTRLSTDFVWPLKV